jgi:hypothetical protein
MADEDFSVDSRIRQSEVDPIPMRLKFRVPIADEGEVFVKYISVCHEALARFGLRALHRDIQVALPAESEPSMPSGDVASHTSSEAR